MPETVADSLPRELKGLGYAINACIMGLITAFAYSLGGAVYLRAPKALFLVAATLLSIVAIRFYPSAPANEIRSDLKGSKGVSKNVNQQHRCASHDD